MQFLARTRLGLVCFLPSGLRGVSRSSLAITCRCNYWHLGLERISSFCSNMWATNAGDFSSKLTFQFRYDGQPGHFLQQLGLWRMWQVNKYRRRCQTILVLFTNWPLIHNEKDSIVTTPQIRQILVGEQCTGLKHLQPCDLLTLRESSFQPASAKQTVALTFKNARIWIPYRGKTW